MKKIVSLHLICFFIIQSFSFAQSGGRTYALPKGTIVVTVTADMDCKIKLNSSTKIVPVINNRLGSSVTGFTMKAGETVKFKLRSGKNKIEAFTMDNKNTLKKELTAKAYGRPTVDLVFLGDDKFLDYIKKGNTLMVEGAIRKNPSLVNGKGLLEVPLLTAIINSKAEIVKLLIKKGANFNKPQKLYPLHKVTQFVSNMIPKKGGDPDDIVLAKLFMAKGCKVMDEDEGGNTPLHVAVRHNKLELVKYYVGKGADVNAVNSFDATPLDIAMDKGYISVMDYLKSKDAKEAADLNKE